MHVTDLAPAFALAAALNDLPSGGHLCSIYENEAEYLAVPVLFMRLGLERGEQCIYVADDSTEERVRQALIDGGIDVAWAVKRNALILTTATKVQLKHDSRDPYRMYTFWKKAGEQAQRDGFSALRCAGETEWVVRGTPGAEQWISYESHLTHMAPQRNCTFLCQYNRQRFPAELMLSSIRAHPTVIHRGAVVRNIYHAAAEEILGQNANDRDTERLLSTLRQREYAESVLQEQHGELRQNEQRLWQMQVELQEDQLRLRVALEVAPVPFALLRAVRDAAGRIIDFSWVQANPEAARVIGRAVAELIGNRMADLRPPGWHAPDVFERFARVANTGEQDSIETSVAHNGVEARWQNIVVKLHDGVAVWFREITEDARADEVEEALRTTQAALAQASRLTTLGELTASIAHEVAQPLAGITVDGGAAMRWLAAVPPNLKEARIALTRIVDSGRRATDVIERIRALATKADWVREPLEVNRAILEVVTLLEGELNRNHVVLLTAFDERLQPIHADRVHLQQVMLNLIINALEAISARPEGPREIIVSTHHEANGLQVTVRDSGIGLVASNPEEVFKSFYTTKPHGMGLGLSISRTIVEAHGGRLWAARNEVGPGTTFHFTLPGEHSA